MKVYKYSRDGFKTEEIKNVVEIRPAISPAGYLALLLKSGNTVCVSVKSVQSIQPETDEVVTEDVGDNDGIRIVYEQPVIYYEPGSADTVEVEKALLSFIGTCDKIEFIASDLCPFLSEKTDPRAIGRALRKLTKSLLEKGFALKTPLHPSRAGRVYSLERTGGTKA